MLMTLQNIFFPSAEQLLHLFHEPEQKYGLGFPSDNELDYRIGKFYRYFLILCNSQIEPATISLINPFPAPEHSTSLKWKYLQMP